MKMLIGATTINYCYLHRRHQTVHVVASVTVVTEQQLVIVLTRPAEGAGLALDALPGVLLDTDQHVLSELEAGGVAWKTTVIAWRTNHRLIFFRKLRKGGGIRTFREG